MISTTPQSTPPRISVTMPAITKMTARIQSRCSICALPLTVARTATGRYNLPPAAVADKHPNR